MATCGCRSHGPDKGLLFRCHRSRRAWQTLAAAWRTERPWQHLSLKPSAAVADVPMWRMHLVCQYALMAARRTLRSLSGRDDDSSGDGSGRLLSEIWVRFPKCRVQPSSPAFHHFPKHVAGIRHSTLAFRGGRKDFSTKSGSSDAGYQPGLLLWLNLTSPWSKVPQADEEKPTPISSVNMASCLALGSAGSIASTRAWRRMTSSELASLRVRCHPVD